MSNYDFEEDNSDGESDLAFLAEIHALSNPTSASSPRNQPNNGAAPHNPNFPTTALVSSDSDDDFEFLRHIQHRYGSGDEAGGSGRAFSPRSIITPQSVNSDPEDDEDFEILRAIQRRFRQYSAVGTNVDARKGTDDVRGNNILHSHVDEIADGTDGKELGFYDHTANAESPADEEEKRDSLSCKPPKSALAFINAIKRNRSAQKHIRGKMLNLEARMEELKMIMRRVKIIWEFDVRRRKKIWFGRECDRAKFISVPSNDKKVSGAMKHGPQENLRVVNHRIAFQKYPQSIIRAKWTEEDRRNLKSGVVQQIQKSLLLKSLERIDESEASASVDGIMSMIGGVEVNPQTMKSFLPNIDWNELASTYLPRRSGLECQARWINYEDPLINHEQWVHMEDKGLLLYVQQKGFNWVDLADSLRTNRTPYECFARYQRSLNPCLIKREWTPAEDAELTAAVQAYGESNWTVVSFALEGRTGPQCSNRWLKTLLPSKQRKGRWEPHEDARLKVCVMLMGSKCWNKIAEFVPGRTQASCRDRWVNCLDPSLNLGKWTNDEDKKLEEGIRIHGYSWTKVASCVPPRTDSQCRRRWMVLFPDEVVQLQTVKKLRRAVLPSNFVDREPNRPTLEADDFLGLAPVVANVVSSRKKEKKLSRSKKLYKVSDAAFCKLPKRPRSKRTRRRQVSSFEIPMIRNDANDALPRKSRRAKGGLIKQGKCREADLTIANLKMSLNSAGKKRKRELNNGSLANKSIHSDPDEGQKQFNVIGDRDDESACTAGRLQEEHQQDCLLTGLGSMKSGNSSGVACGSKIAGKRLKKRRLNSVEPQDCEDLTLAELFGRAAFRKSRRKG